MRTTAPLSRRRIKSLCSEITVWRILTRSGEAERMNPTMAQYQLYKDGAGEWRWRYISSNGNNIAVSSEGYVNKADAQHSIDLVKNSKNDPVVEK